MADPFRRFRLLIAYDGRPYDGWQSQPSGNTIQDYIQTGIHAICPEISTIHGSGRTDAGVSADGQVAHFDAPIDWKMDSSAWSKAINTKLPRTIRIMDCVETAPDFHARYSARGKVYRYRIFTGTVLPPLDYRLAWHQPRLDLEKFSEALKIFVGEHHFKAFSANRNDGKDEGRDCLREIFSIEASSSDRTNNDDLINIDIHGSGFLYKMVRFIIGTGVRLSEGKLEYTIVKNWLNDPDPAEKSPLCAPADGLSLRKVIYG